MVTEPPEGLDGVDALLAAHGQRYEHRVELVGVCGACR